MNKDKFLQKVEGKNYLIAMPGLPEYGYKRYFSDRDISDIDSKRRISAISSIHDHTIKSIECFNFEEVYEVIDDEADRIIPLGQKENH